MITTFHIYVIAVVFAAVALLIASLISNAIKFEGGANPSDPRKRRVWFWLIGLIATLANFLFGIFSYYYPAGNDYAKSQLIIAIGASTGICLVLYILLGFILSKIFKNGKLGNWF
jgi:sulfoxide reductase heme-binding subunit YedZ